MTLLLVHAMWRSAGRRIPTPRRGRLTGEKLTKPGLALPGAELTEVLPVGALVEIAPQEALDGLRHLVRRDAIPYRPSNSLVPAHRPTQGEVVGIDHLPLDLDLLPLDPDVRDPVLAAAIGAPAHVNLEMLFEARHPGLQLLHQPAREALRLRQGELAEFGPRARNRSPPKGRGAKLKPGLFDLLGEGFGPAPGDEIRRAH